MEFDFKFWKVMEIKKSFNPVLIGWLIRWPFSIPALHSRFVVCALIIVCLALFVDLNLVIA